MNLKISLIFTLISGLSTVIGSFFTFVITKNVKKLIVFSLSFSLGIMIIISIFELLPTSLKSLIKNYDLVYGLTIAILTFILGYLSIFTIDKRIKNENQLSRIGIMNFISLMIHNLPEGIIVFMSSTKDIKLGLKMCLAIMFHNIPEGIAISIPLFYSNQNSRGKCLLLTLISGLTEFFGALLCYFALRYIISDIVIAFMQIFTSGMMISLSINKILKEVILYNASKYIYIGILSSCFISMLLLLL